MHYDKSDCRVIMHYDKSMHDVSIHDFTSRSNLPLLSMIIEIGHKDQKQLDNSMI